MTNDAKVAAIRETIEGLINAGTTSDLSALDKIYHDTMTTYMIDTDSNLMQYDKPGFIAMLKGMVANNDGKLELLIVEPVTRRRILSLLPKLMSGEHMDESEIHHQRVTKLSVLSSEPIPSHLDGEIQPLQQRFDFSILTDALRLL